MVFICEGKDNKRQEIKWTKINGAYVPVLTICNQQLGPILIRSTPTPTPIPTPTPLLDAPVDGNIYGRKDSSWTNISQAAALQLRRGTETERLQITPLEGEPIYTTDTKKFYIGDGVTVGGLEISGANANAVYPQLNPPGMIRIVSVKPDNTIDFGITSTTGYQAVRWWDGSVDVVSGVAGKVVPTSGNWSKSAPKEIFIWSCTEGNATQSGELTTFGATSMHLTTLNVRGLSSLQLLNVPNNNLSTLDLRGCTALTGIYAPNNLLTELDVSQCIGLDTLFCQNNLLTELNVSGLTQLFDFSCHNNLLTSLSCNGCFNMQYMFVQNNNLSELNVNGFILLETLDASDNMLTSVRAVGVNGLGYASALVSDLNISVNYDIGNNNLSAEALNQFYTDLGVTSTGSIYVGNNPGTATDNPAIATNKNYTVYGS